MSIYGQYLAVNQVVVLNNQDATLNAFAELLGLSMRMTEDQLTRDMLASTASIYNCTGGVNGKEVAVLKSALIDLEPVVAFS
jgi:hypothetical protein